jgi:hypothetical protein
MDTSAGGITERGGPGVFYYQICSLQVVVRFFAHGTIVFHCSNIVSYDHYNKGMIVVDSNNRN